MVDTCNFITQETEAGGSLQIPGQPNLRGDFQVSQGNGSHNKNSRNCKVKQTLENIAP